LVCITRIRVEGTRCDLQGIIGNVLRGCESSASIISSGFSNGYAVISFRVDDVLCVDRLVSNMSAFKCRGTMRLLLNGREIDVSMLK